MVRKPDVCTCGRSWASWVCSVCFCRARSKAACCLDFEAHLLCRSHLDAHLPQQELIAEKKCAGNLYSTELEPEAIGWAFYLLLYNKQ